MSNQAIGMIETKGLVGMVEAAGQMFGAAVSQSLDPVHNGFAKLGQYMVSTGSLREKKVSFCPGYRRSHLGVC